MSKYGKYRPSSADRWMACHASIRLSFGIPEKTSPYAEEGTWAHGVMEKTLLKGSVDLEDCEGNEELFEAMRVTHDAVAEERSRYHDMGTMHVETRVWPTKARDDISGTADIIISGRLKDDDQLAVTAMDLKYGKGVLVSPTTAQLAIYVLGAAALVGGDVAHFRTTIIQPRARAGKLVKNHDWDRAALLSFNGRMHRAIDACEDPNAEAVAGSHCMWCLAKDTCKTYASSPNLNKKAFDTDFGEMLPTK